MSKLLIILLLSLLCFWGTACVFEEDGTPDTVVVPDSPDTTIIHEDSTPDLDVDINSSDG